jgi:hypothetical protein
MHVIDFGIARFFEDRTLTHTGQLVGTPMYMSPEQVTGRIALDHRTDIYSLGMILYELLTLRPPITAATREAVLRSIATRPVSPVSWRNPSVPRSLEGIVHKAIARDPDERYQTGKEFAEDLQAQLEGKAVLAKPYHHKFDPRELDAARPRWLIFAVVFCFFFCIVALAGSLSAALGVTVLDRSRWLVGLAFSSVGLLIAAGSLFAGLGILAGRSWARIACVLICVLFAAHTAAGTLTTFRALADQPLGLRAAPLGVLTFVCLAAGSIVWGLFRRKTSDWFRYARSLRAEHQAQRNRR